jgi:DNA repair exonuclease SbcCD ATPase subunit
MRAPLILIGFLGAGVVGAVAGQILFTPTEPPTSTDPEVARLVKRIDDLESESARMRDEIGRLSVAAPAPAAPGEAPALVPADVPRPEAVTPADPAPVPSGLVPEERIEEKVRETIQEIAKDQREKKERWAALKQAEKEKKWLEGIAPKLGLSGQQVEDLTKLLEKRRKAIFAYNRAKEQLGPDAPPERREALEQRIRAFGQTLDEELRLVLSTEQYEAIMQGRKPAGR